MNINFKQFGYIAILNLLITIISYIVDFSTIFNYENSIPKAMPTTVYIIGLIISTIVILGYFKIAKLDDKEYVKYNKLLKTACFAFIAINILVSLTAILIDMSTMTGLAIGTGAIILYGVASGIFGLGIIKLDSKFGKIVKTLGILYLINGLFVLTIFLGLLSPLLVLAISIIQIPMFFNLSKEFDK